MYKAMNYWVFGGFTGEKTQFEFIDWAAEKGLDGVELTIGDVIKRDISESECRKTASYAAEKKIGLRTVVSGGGWGCFLCTPDREERSRAVKATIDSLRIASWLGAETILVVPGATEVAWDPSRPAISYKDAWKYASESISGLIPEAERYGVNIGIENVWNRFLISPMEWKFFLDQFNSDRIGIYFDVGNACLNCRPEDFPEILGKRIKAVHLKNFEASDCAGGLHGFGDDLMKGVVNFKKVFAAMDAIGYDGPYTAEMIPFSRGEAMKLPDMTLADKTAAQLLTL